MGITRLYNSFGIIAFLCALAVVVGAIPVQASESTFDRILRTGVIRCGYYVFPPITKMDVNTKKLTGFSVDFMDHLAARAGLKVEWAEEITWGNWVPALQARRFDVACTPMWPELPMGRAVLFTNPLFYAGITPFVRADDPRFAGKVTREMLNKPDITFVSQDGNASFDLTKRNFPDAKMYALPPEGSTNDYYQALIYKKADVGLTDRNSIYEFNQKNKVKLKMILEDQPIKTQTYPLAVARGDTELRDFLNLGIDEMNNSGEIDRLLRKWEGEPGKTYLRVAPPFAAP